MEVQLSVWEVTSAEGYERLRTLSYPDTSVILIVYAVNDRKTFQNALELVGLTSFPYTFH